MGHTQNGKHLFDRNQNISFQKLILSKYHMFSLSYESFSIFSDVFCPWSHFQLKQLCCQKNNETGISTQKVFSYFAGGIHVKVRSSGYKNNLVEIKSQIS